MVNDYWLMNGHPELCEGAKECPKENANTDNRQPITDN